MFKRNILTAAENQLNDPGAEHGVTPFSDMTPEEFARNKLGYLPGAERRTLKDLLKLRGPREEAQELPTDNLPETLDWREKGAVASVKNQVSIIVMFFLLLSENIRLFLVVLNSNLFFESWCPVVWCDCTGYVWLVLRLQCCGGGGGVSLLGDRQATGSQRAASR